MQPDTAVSIIVPNYNHSKFLRQRLNSIFNQTYQNFEVILLDDCSTDGSQEILREYSDREQVSHLIINKENSGNPFIQWKRGFELAKGKYIWIAESDDWAENDFLQEMVAILENNESAVLAYSQSYIVNEEGQHLRSNLEYTSNFDPNKWQADYLNDGNDEIKSFLRVKNTIPNASAVVFRNLPQVSELVNTDFRLNGDWWFWVKLVESKKMFFKGKHLNYFRFHQATTRTMDSYKKRQRYFEEHLMMIKLFEGILPKKYFLNEKKLLFLKKPFPKKISTWKDLVSSYRIETKERFPYLLYLTTKIKSFIQN